MNEIKALISILNEKVPMFLAYRALKETWNAELPDVLNSNLVLYIIDRYLEVSYGCKMKVARPLIFFFSFLLAIVILVHGLIDLYTILSVKSYQMTTTGRIVHVDRDMNNPYMEIMCFPPMNTAGGCEGYAFSFRTKDKKAIQAYETFYIPPRYAIGEEVTVFYGQRNPQIGILDYNAEGIGVTGILFPLAGIGVSLFLLIQFRRLRK